ncbi:MAG: HDIG domain-containing protein [Candidatus Dadabacteria bacterium]|nr:MAG: HDIG domain-containing protein [Candidatus Dadabacteria bacterium]
MKTDTPRAAASIKQPQQVQPTVRRSLKGTEAVFVSLLTAVVAEFLLHHFLPLQLTYSPVARIAVVFIFLYTLHRYALLALRDYRGATKNILTLNATLIGSIILVSFSRIMGLSMLAYFRENPYISGLTFESFNYAIPYAAGALLIQAVLGLHFGLIFCLAQALIVGVYTPEQPLLVPYVLVTGLVACLSTVKLRTRSAFVKAGLNIAIIAIPFALAGIVISGGSNVTDITCRLIGVFIGGMLCSFIAAGFTPVAEYLGGYVTDMRLLEMATLDHPLLKELSIQAPGTWNHSMVMGMMVESAANEIGANAVLARVGAYFHDIGKTKKPLYFVENQPPGDNRHDKLSTSMSALIIRSHVKDGLELARKYRLPVPLQDMIPQHHGTSMIEYFYEKAKKEAEEAGEDPTEVDASLYTYPGPKPQSREAGLLMLADGIEAAARTLSEPSFDRIQGMVQKLINKVFASGQLDECELTLKDLHKIAKCYTRILTGIYHQRVQYAEPAEKGQERDQGTAPKKKGETRKSASKKSGAKKSHARTDNGDEKKEKPKEDLKRLGL